MVKEKPCYWFLLLLVLPVLLSCKRDAPERNEAEEIYQADYESPLHKWGFMDTLGTMVIDPVFDDTGIFSEGAASVNKDGRWGFINQEGQYLVEPTYKAAWAFHERMARVSPFVGHDHFVTRTGKMLKSEDWSAVDDFSEGLAKVKVGNTFGFIDSSGQLVLPAIYSKCRSFRNGLAIVSIDEKAGVINKKGVEILSRQFNTIKVLDKINLILGNTDHAANVYDLEGNEKLNLPGVKAIDSEGSMVTIQKGELMFFVELADGTILPGPGWSNIVYLGEQRWAARDETGFFLLNEKGVKMNMKPLAQINRFVDGYAAYSTGKQWGYMDIHGQELTPDVFGLAWDFKNGFARAAFNDGIAFINRKLELAFYPPPGTMDMRDFAEGLAPVQIEKQ